MNWDRIEGNWNEFKGSARKYWGKLTDDDMQEARGDREQLAGLIQQKYGIAKDEAERQIDEFAAKH